MQNGAKLRAGLHLQRLNRRQRKKLRLGEFQELGFEITGVCPEPLPEDAADRFLDGLFEFVEARRLCAGGGFGAGSESRFSMFVCAIGRGSATEEDRQAIEAWLKSQPCIRNVCAGPLRDAWHA